MKNAALLAVVIPLMAGPTACLDTGSDLASPDSTPELRLVTLGRDGFEQSYGLQNASAEPVGPACTPWACGDDPLVRVEALQESGEWIDRGDYVRSPDGLDDTARVAPQGVIEIGSSSSFTEHAGTFRLVARVADDSGAEWAVTREVAVVGWSDETLDRARDLIRRADESSCGYVRSRAMRTLTVRLEPDALIDLRRDASDDEDYSIVLEMVRRGTFVRELAFELASAPMDLVRNAARRLGARGQDPVRRVLARRYFGLVADNDARLTTEDWYTLTALQSVWPDDGAELLVGRLARGNDEGADLQELLETFRYADRELLMPYVDTILHALDARCTGATGELVSSCDATREHFTAEFAGIGMRGVGSSGGCGGVFFVPSAICNALGTEWAAFEAEAGELEVQELGDHVTRVRGRTRAPASFRP